MKKFLCFCNFDSVAEWFVSCPSVEDAKKLFMDYLLSRWSPQFITFIQIFELVHEEDFTDDQT